ncbi:SGNH/GDSL hydrolase family protein [Nocardioides sp.]|uniref:SGNH/GDSL hydrolase family protein n=1 Tax=Nocardioides sp. TaxID=35761 RepID=UPI002BB6D838|nr:SGNH/GDSL hydrolase family protein [Nocardioides sp.]HSX66588.1 SGNH/GDSL hydrolase family protein [Nocardioides sp.]
MYLDRLSHRLRGSALLAVAALMIAAPASPAGAAPPEEPPATSWYLSLGDSFAAGEQTGGTADLTGGFAGRVLTSLQAENSKVKLANLGCVGGETTTTFTDGGICSYDEGSQLDQAVVFLRAHARTTRLVTLSLGGNNVQRCADRTTGQIDLVCVQQGMVRLAQELPAIVRTLRAAAPGVEIIVANYYNPFLASWFVPVTGPAQAQASATLQTQINALIAGSASAGQAEVADVATEFRSLDWTPLPNGVPTNVALICTHTYMCVPGARPNIHPNDAGYARIATAIQARVG